MRVADPALPPADGPDHAEDAVGALHDDGIPHELVPPRGRLKERSVLFQRLEAEAVAAVCEVKAVLAVSLEVREEEVPPGRAVRRLQPGAERADAQQNEERTPYRGIAGHLGRSLLPV